MQCNSQSGSIRANLTWPFLPSFFRALWDSCWLCSPNDSIEVYCILFPMPLHGCSMLSRWSLIPLQQRKLSYCQGQRPRHLPCQSTKWHNILVEMWRCFVKGNGSSRSLANWPDVIGKYLFCVTKVGIMWLDRKVPKKVRSCGCVIGVKISKVWWPVCQ